MSGAQAAFLCPRGRWPASSEDAGDAAERERTTSEIVEHVRRRLALIGWVANGAGTVVVSVTIGLLIPIFIGTDEAADLALFNAPMIVAYLLIVGYLLTRHSGNHLLATVRWVLEDRVPDPREHSRTLMLPIYGTKLIALGWTGAIVIFAATNAAAHSWEFAAVVGATIWLGAETTCALVYLLSERILRPITACALAAAPPRGNVAPSVRGRLIMAWLLGTGAPLLGVLVVATVGVSKSGVDVAYVSAAVLFLGAVAYGIGLLVAIFAAKAIAEPVTSVRAGLGRIERGELDVTLAVDDGSEVGQLQAGFNRMAEGLREREKIRDLFGRQVGEDVARAALRTSPRLGGEEREIGALFVDIIGSSALAMSMPATEVMRVLNRFFRVVIEVVEAEGGLVNKFEGDAALCVFGAPVLREDPAGAALQSARKLALRLTREVPEIDFGIGVSAGMAVAGNVGAEQRFEYTVIGNPVNEAARLCELAKERPERVLASASALGDAIKRESDAWRVTDSAVLRGRRLPTGVAHPRS